jgi:hypothetical protein
MSDPRTAVERLRAADVAWVRDLRDTTLYQCGHWLGGEDICLLPHGHEKHTAKYALAADPVPAPLDVATRRAILAQQPACGSCGHNKVHHLGATYGKAPPPDEKRCWVYKCRCKGFASATPPEPKP